MSKYSAKIYSSQENVIDFGYPFRKIQKTHSSGDEVNFEDEKWDNNDNYDNEILEICQALLLSTFMLLLSYHSVRYGQTEYSIMENGKIVHGYAYKAVISLSVGYSFPYSMVSLFAVGMLAYSLVSKSPRWSLPSIILYLTDLVYDISGALVAIWLFFTHFSLAIALSYSLATFLLIFGELWIWFGVLKLYEHRTLK